MKRQNILYPKAEKALRQLGENLRLARGVVEMFKSEGISIKRAEYFEGEIKAFIDVSK